MSASEKLKGLPQDHADRMQAVSYAYADTWFAETFKNALPQIVAVVEAAERRRDAILVIRSLGFVGNAHYCADCLNHFHEDRGQHEPDCSVLAEILADEEWYQQDDHPLVALEEVLS